MAVFNTFYSIPIPAPVASGLNQLAQISTPEGVFEVLWMSKTHQVVVRHNTEWYIQPNGRIDESLSFLIGCNPMNISARKLILFDRDYPNGTDAPDYMEQKLLECEWSDYAYDKMVFQATMDVDGLEYDTYDFVD